MKKKLLAFVMAATMVFSLAACGSSSSNDSSNSGNSSDSDSAQSGDEVQTFKLGSIGPLTGDAAIYGQAVVNGAQLAVDEINASDSKIKFEFQGEDDEADGENDLAVYYENDERGDVRREVYRLAHTVCLGHRHVRECCEQQNEKRARAGAVKAVIRADEKRYCAAEKRGLEL